MAAYARVSTVNQVLEHDSSLDTQIQRIEHKAEYESKEASATGRRPWVIVDRYCEQGSGKDTDRRELQRLLADIRAEKVDLVCVTKIDRITRSLIDFYGLWALFEDHGVEFVSLGETFETSTATGKAMLKLTLVFAELERERTSERTKEKIQARREAGLWHGGIVPLGLKSNPADKTTLLVDDTTEKLVRRHIFGKYLELGTARALTRYLAQAGLKRPVRKTKNGKTGGREFTTQSLIDMLSNTVYVAKRTLDGRVVASHWPALIDQDVFDRVQALLAKNREKRPTGQSPSSYVYLLEGLLRCGDCGAIMCRAIGTGRNNLYFYYRCATKNKTAGEGCKLRDIPAPAIEAFVLDQLSDYAVDTSALETAVREANAGRDEKLTTVEAELQAAKATLLQVQKKVSVLLDELEQAGAGGKTSRTGQADNDDPVRVRLVQRKGEAADLKARVQDLETQRDVLKRDVLEATTVASAYTRFPFLLAEARRLGALEELRAVLQGVIDVVEWRQNPADPKQGDALIQLYPLPSFTKAEGVDGPAVGSRSRQDWLRMESGALPHSAGL